MEDLSRYKNRFSESGMKILESSLAEIQRRNQYYILPEHILYVLIKENPELFKSTMLKYSIDPKQVQIAVEKRLENIPIHEDKGFQIAPQVTDTFKYSIDKARAEGRQTIEPADICHVLATWKSSLIEDILQNPDGVDSFIEKTV